MGKTKCRSTRDDAVEVAEALDLTPSVTAALGAALVVGVRLCVRHVVVLGDEKLSQDGHFVDSLLAEHVQ